MLRTCSQDGGFNFHTREFEKYPKSKTEIYNKRFAKILVIDASGIRYMLDILDILSLMQCFLNYNNI